MVLSVDEQVLAAIRELTSENDVNPTIRQIAERVGLSKTTVHRHLVELCDRGTVLAPPRSGAGWRLAAG